MRMNVFVPSPVVVGAASLPVVSFLPSYVDSVMRLLVKRFGLAECPAFAICVELRYAEEEVEACPY